MDFLDPRKKRTRRIRLMAGYLLVGIAIGMATVIMVFSAYGYGVDTKTGNVVQNGLLFVNSLPGGAAITVNGQPRGQTSERYVLPAGTYKVVVSKEGYRDWQKTFTLEAHSVERLVYPFLFPKSLTPETLEVYSAPPALVTTSPDRKWLLLAPPLNQAGGLRFDLLDTSRLNQAKISFSVPAAVLASPAPTTALKIIEWSTNNRHVLLERSFSGGYEFVLVDREVPANSFSVNRLFQTSPKKVLLRDKQPDQLYVLDGAEATLRVADVPSASLSAPLLLQVLDFKQHGGNIISYVTADNAQADMAQFRIYENGETYLLYSLPASDQYQLEIARFDGDWYYVVSTAAEQRVEIFKNPLDKLKSGRQQAATPLLALKMPGYKTVAFSANARFVSAAAGPDMAVYDIETDRRYHYRVEPPLDGPLQWMDGHRFIGLSEGNVLVIDFDGTNQQLLTASNLPAGGLFDRDYETLLVSVPLGTGGSVALKKVPLRAGADLPDSAP